MFLLFLTSDMFKKYFKLCYLLAFVILLPSCGSLTSKKRPTTKRVVPKNRNRYYNPKKDKRKSRVKKVRVFS